MKLRLLPASLLLSCTLTHAADPKPIAKPLEEQVSRLVALIKDSYATGHPELAEVQTLRTGKNSQVTLTVFNIEAFGMGNNYRQYLAAFSPDTNEKNEVHYSLLDVIQIGGDGWRAIEGLDAKLVRDPTGKQILIDIPVMVNIPGDSVNAPSSAEVIHLSLGEVRSPRIVEKN
ncbi:MAG TPA: hypothetical protein VGC62_25610 [Pseudomonas sp.]|uniref:hypothetical protein n=1 Tax=Pseudomonas sp. TaxID=306 RepID=UPI002ED82F1B